MGESDVLPDVVVTTRRRKRRHLGVGSRVRRAWRRFRFRKTVTTLVLLTAAIIAATAASIHVAFKPPPLPIEHE
jgi:hypothetical protein